MYLGRTLPMGSAGHEAASCAATAERAETSSSSDRCIEHARLPRGGGGVAAQSPEDSAARRLRPGARCGAVREAAATRLCLSAAIQYKSCFPTTSKPPGSHPASNRAEFYCHTARITSGAFQRHHSSTIESGRSHLSQSHVTTFILFESTHQVIHSVLYILLLEIYGALRLGSLDCPSL